jgi:ribosomal protein S8
MEFLYKRYDTKTAIEQVQERIENCKINIEITEAMTQAAYDMQGKPMTKRYANKVKDILGEKYRVSYGTDYGMFKLIVRHESQDKSVSILLGYKDNEQDNIINAENIQERAKAYYLDEERLPKYESALEKMPNFVERMKQAQNEVRAILNDAGAYGVEYLIETRKD